MAQHPDKGAEAPPEASVDDGRSAALAHAHQLVADRSYAEAQPLLADLVQKHPQNVEVHELLGATLYHLGDLDASQRHLSSAYDLDAAYGAVRTNLAATLLRLGRANDALIYASEAVAERPEDSRSWQMLGNARGARGEPDQAIAALERALALDACGIDTLSALNKICFDADRVDQALVYGERALIAKDTQFCEAFPALAKRFTLLAGLRLGAPPPANSRANVLAFTLWGDTPIYTEGMMQNAKLAKEFYPGWQCRLYHDGSLDSDLVDRFTKLDVACIRVGGGPARLMGTFWRFLASDDPTVGRFVCRDADARLSERERAAVAAWEQSDKPIHIMRDHPIHIDLMLAGLWGGTAGVLPALEPIASALYGGQAHRWHDQEFLSRIVWPLIRDHALIHDSDYKLFGAVPFPIERPIGSWRHIGGAVPVSQQTIVVKARRAGG